MNKHIASMMTVSNNVIHSIQQSRTSINQTVAKEILHQPDNSFKTQECIVSQLIKETREDISIINVYRLAIAINALCLIFGPLEPTSRNYDKYEDTLRSQYAIFLWLCSRVNIKSLCKPEQVAV